MASADCLISGVTNNCLVVESDGGLHVPCPENAIQSIVPIVDTCTVLVTNTDDTTSILDFGAIVDACSTFQVTNVLNFVVPDGGAQTLPGTLTAPKDGVYIIREALSGDGAAGSEFEMEMFVNATGTGRQLANEMVGTVGFAGGETFPFRLTAGDLLTFEIRSINGALSFDIVQADLVYLGDF